MSIEGSVAPLPPSKQPRHWMLLVLVVGSVACTVVLLVGALLGLPASTLAAIGAPWAGLCTVIAAWKL